MRPSGHEASGETRVGSDPRFRASPCASPFQSGHPAGRIHAYHRGGSELAMPTGSAANASTCHPGIGKCRWLMQVCQGSPAGGPLLWPGPKLNPQGWGGEGGGQLHLGGRAAKEEGRGNLDSPDLQPPAILWPFGTFATCCCTVGREHELDLAPVAETVQGSQCLEESGPGMLSSRLMLPSPIP